MHGIGKKNSGFDGTWHEMDHIMKLHDSVNKGVNPSTGMFINPS